MNTKTKMEPSKQCLICPSNLLSVIEMIEMLHDIPLHIDGMVY